MCVFEELRCVGEAERQEHVKLSDIPVGKIIRHCCWSLVLYYRKVNSRRPRDALLE